MQYAECIDDFSKFRQLLCLHIFSNFIPNPCILMMEYLKNLNIISSFLYEKNMILILNKNFYDFEYCCKYIKLILLILQSLKMRSGKIKIS